MLFSLQRHSKRTNLSVKGDLALFWVGQSFGRMNCVDAMSSWWGSHGKWRMVYLLFLGQLVSFIMALASFSTSLIADLGVDAPLTQMLFAYLALALVFGSILLYRRRRLLVSSQFCSSPCTESRSVFKHETLAKPSYCALLGNWFRGTGICYWEWLTFKEIIWFTYHSNFLMAVNKAYQYSSITSVTLLDCWTIPSVLVLTWVFLGTRYSLLQLFGAALCVLGLGLVLLSDAGVGGGGGSKPLLGDILVIAGTVFYAVSNVGEEFCVKKKDLVEVVSMIGLYGTLVSVVEISIFERQSIESITWSTELVLAFVGYVLTVFLFYSFAPSVLKMSGATMFNLSLLTSDMWAVVVRICFYHQQVDWLYYLAFAIVVVGLVIYSKNEKEPEIVQAIEDGDLTNYQVLSNGSAVPPEESSTS
ncbi:solute carrier family 35 member F2-like isoform X1 [Rhodamnia argentea]|uniref:Solute carrier family 35 member F2-like isoform X1 n=1 Tax=Rhodamnia argentea TaxID=178133 RepID=A0ABM3GRM8_9MYRT|nr:solute carrier family 35 member F2-like isoform X1 [Rhodamnia argentea]XP_048127004.1 solute carrier family 35 member F2-like isoform X1 [Rhodamnia argentea]